eukprot:TRINITY_DN7619_c0_g1_i1.p1 TRINITY_DN7619_c0_g1~~TRINITY_DN7619_c0_g1_i1.p1  ORF type:complete len:571 (-),score=134.54 TRINITY_DN7619_c0_g1_i1:1766-3478(-)
MPRLPKRSAGGRDASPVKAGKTTNAKKRPRDTSGDSSANESEHDGAVASDEDSPMGTGDNGDQSVFYGNGCQTTGILDGCTSAGVSVPGRWMKLSPVPVSDEKQLINLHSISALPETLRINVNELRQICVGVPVIVLVNDTAFSSGGASSSSSGGAKQSDEQFVVPDLPMVEFKIEDMPGKRDSSSDVFRVLHTITRSAKNLKQLEICFEVQMENIFSIKSYRKYIMDIQLIGEDGKRKRFISEVEFLPPPRAQCPDTFILKSGMTGEGSDTGELYMLNTNTKVKLRLRRDPVVYQGHSIFFTPPNLQDQLYDLCFKPYKLAKGSKQVSQNLGLEVLSRNLISFAGLRSESCKVVFEYQSAGDEGLDKRSLQCIVTWPFESPPQLDLHVLSSLGDHVCSTNKFDPDDNIEVESWSQGLGWGPEIALIREVQENVTYRFYVEHVSASYADLQNKLYNGKQLWDSQATARLVDQHGAMIESLQVPHHQQVSNGFFWDLFTVEGDTGRITVHNNIVDDHLSLPTMKSRKSNDNTAPSSNVAKGDRDKERDAMFTSSGRMSKKPQSSASSKKNK